MGVACVLALPYRRYHLISPNAMCQYGRLFLIETAAPMPYPLWLVRAIESNPRRIQRRMAFPFGLPQIRIRFYRWHRVCRRESYTYRMKERVGLMESHMPCIYTTFLTGNFPFSRYSQKWSLFPFWSRVGERQLHIHRKWLFPSPGTRSPIILWRQMVERNVVVCYPFTH